ncbi:MAG: SgcJ/EcaC family oxidoreductase [Chitinophagaceae bacterium]|nr:MAG: SgcJ/EcaC family oxidoreductase [Chitinophagaceae bacterium]
MKKVVFAFALITAGLFISTAANAQSNGKAAIEKLIFAYRDALNASDAAKVVSLYTTDGVLLANAAPTAVGTEQVKGTYQYVFDNFKYNLDFTIGEIVVNGNYAFARSTSKGSFVIKESGQTVPDENRELFVFEKVKGEWKIARYMYNKAK